MRLEAPLVLFTCQEHSVCGAERGLKTAGFPLFSLILEGGPGAPGTAVAISAISEGIREQGTCSRNTQNTLDHTLNPEVIGVLAAAAGKRRTKRGEKEKCSNKREIRLRSRVA